MRSRPGDDAVLGPNRALAIDGPAEPVEDTAQDGRADRHSELLLAQPHRGAGTYAGEIAKWHEGDGPVPETHHLGTDHPFGLEIDPADGAELQDEPRDFDRGADDSDHLA